MSIRKLDQEIQERIKRAMSSLKSPDPDDYHGTAEREYQKELARILQKEGNKAANASTDQLIAGKLKAVGYGLDEIEEAIKNNSPMAVKPTLEQCKFYGKNVVKKAQAFKSFFKQELPSERCFDKLGIETKTEQSLQQKTDELEEFNFIFADPDYLLCKHRGRVIHLPKDIDIEDDDTPISVFVISQATYQDNQKNIEESDAANLELYLRNQALRDDINIIIE